MGNFYPTHDNLPSYFSYQQVKQLVNHLNTLFKQNQMSLKLAVQLNLDLLKYNSKQWKDSMIPGVMYAIGDQQSIKSQKEKIIMSIKNVYNLHENMKHFEKQMSQDKKLAPSVITPDENLQCCICMDKSPTMMLPCSHDYCDRCTQIHIIEAEEKKCPKCRRQFKCGRESLSRQIFTVIEEDMLYEDLRKIILDSLLELNERQVRNVRKILKGKKGSQKKEEVQF